jgi:acetylornithine deacetylase
VTVPATDTAQLLSELVAIDSVNPSLVPGGAGEAEIAAFIAGWADRAGLEAELLEATPGRPSLLVRAPGSGRGATLMLCGHLDTVTVEGMAHPPHEPRVDGDRLYGRGAYDMKGGVVAALLACREAAGLGLAGDVVVAAVADEEHASLGVQEVLAAARADGAIVTEPTELELIVAHKGFVWGEIEVHGRAAHGSRPHLGEDAIVKMGPVLTALGELDVQLGAREHPRLGRGSVHASLISGGEELSSYPARCLLSVERRTLPGETAEAVEAELAALAGLAGGTARTLLVREPFEVDEDSPFAQTVRAAAAGVLGEPPAIGGASYWADAAFISAAGIPTVMFGPAGEGAHAAQEWVSLSSVEAVTRTLVETARRFCA